VSDVARAATRRAAGEAGLPVHVFDADVVRGALTQDGSEGAYDLVTTSLFLHHLDWPQGVRLLREMARTARRTVLVQDLRRTRLGYGLAWLGLHTLTRSQVARVDGLRSVQGALRLAEVREMCTEAGLDGAIIERRLPQRFTVVWRRT
jgi:2-polyprenyl-3-methyl-5-hydroxy-6-metoxy-1,4-benzoquinol methylase